MSRRCCVHSFRFATPLAVVAAAIVVVWGTTVTALAANAAAAGTAASSAEGWCDDSDLKCDRGSSVSANRDPNLSRSDSESRRRDLAGPTTDPSIDTGAHEGDEESASYEEEDGDNADEDERAPSEWTVLEYWKMMDCDRHYQRHPRPPLVDQATWFYLRGLYAGLMAAEASASSSSSTEYSSLSTLDEEKEEDAASNGAVASSALERSLRQRRRQRNMRMREMAVSQVSWNETMTRKVGFQVPVEVRHTDGRGRGVFTMNAISEDSLVSVGGDEARFLEAELYRAFVELFPAELQCDIIQFSYLDQEIIDGEELDVILVALNDEALLNADWTVDGSEANLIGVEYYGDERDDDENVDEEAAAARRRTGNGATSSNEGRRIEYVARRDIAAGEELLLKYHNFLYDDGWGVFGL
jgi:hypothetical protein